MPSSTVEDYLKAIYRLQGEDGSMASLGKVATSLEVTPGTATTMMKQLVKQGFADYVPRKGVVLTTDGITAVMRVLRRHRLLELFLVQTIGYDWSEVHEEAEVLEHAVSDRLIDRIDKMLGMPARDPHGDPIPDAHGVMRQDESRRLIEFDAGSFELLRVTQTSPEFLDWLQQSGLQPGVTFSLLGRDPVVDVYRLQIRDRDELVQFGPKVSEHLWVRPI